MSSVQCPLGKLWCNNNNDHSCSENVTGVFFFFGHGITLKVEKVSRSMEHVHEAWKRKGRKGKVLVSAEGGSGR